MSTLPTPAEIGFAEFVGKLLSEVLDSVLSAQIEQERRLAELAASAAFSLAEAEALLVGEADVDAELTRLFPADVPGAHAAYEGAPYAPAGGGLIETPSFAALLGVTLLAGVDYAPSLAGQVLTAAGVAKVRGAARARLAAGLLAALRRIVERGVPRVLVDSGRVNARMTFQLTSQAPAAAPASQLSTVVPGVAQRARFALPAASLAAVSLPPTLRLTVRQASDRAPQVAQLQVDVYGEVEVTFRTVV